jgi:hypothetical protein
MSDLAALLNVAPGSAGFMMGQNQALNRESHQSKQQEIAATLQKLQQELMQNQDMHPLKMEYQRLLNSGVPISQAHTQAQTDELGLKNTESRATMDTRIGEIKRKAAHGAANDSMNLGTAFSKYMIDTAGYLDTMPPMMRGKGFMDRIQSSGMPMDNPLAQQWMEMVKNTPPESLPKKLRDMATALAQQEPGYIKEMDKEKLQQEGQTKREGMRNATTLESTRITANSRLEVAQAKARKLGADAVGLANTKRFEEALNKILIAESDPEVDEATLKRLGELKAKIMDAKTQFEKAKNVGKPAVDGMGIPVQGDPKLQGTPGALAPASAPLAGKTKGGIGYKIIPQ